MSSLRSPAATPLDLDDLLAEILLRLPPDPSSLPRASAVCKRWLHLVSDRRFVRRFRIHHRRNPPLLGWFVAEHRGLSFVPTMEAPNRVSPERFSLQIDQGHSFGFLGCRDGLALISHHTRQQFLVWEPFTGYLHQLALPPGFDPTTIPGVNGAVRRAAGDVHFQVVIVATGDDDTQPGQRALAYVYSSRTGLWSDLLSTHIPPDSWAVFLELLDMSVSTTPAVLVGDSIYWELSCWTSSSILEFDFEKQSLAVIQMPDDLYRGNLPFTVIRADGGGLGFLFVSNFTAQFWKRNTDCHGVASWVLWRIIELDKLLSLNSPLQPNITIRGFAEENNMVILLNWGSLFAVQLQSLEFNILSEFEIPAYHYPFESVYTAGTDIGVGHDGGELLHNA